MQILVTGGCGFIGSNFLRLLLAEYPETRLTNLDLLTYAGNSATVADLAEAFPFRYSFIQADIADEPAIDAILSGKKYDAIVNFAAESHVDRSITGPHEFVRTNVLGTSILLHSARKHGVKRFVQISTDEVYGSLGPTGKFTETTPLDPSSPYSASKTGGDLLALACHHTYGQEVLVTRCSNNYGPYQFPEKLIPLMIINASQDKKLPVYGDGLNVRDWIHVEDHCEAVAKVLFEGKLGEVYNIGGDGELLNIEVVKMILDRLGKSHNLISYVTDRLGHDRRYAIDSSKIQMQLGWRPKHRPETSIPATVDWYLANRAWWEPLLGRK
ncbi:MAG: dTDP-glucose 4,6-dehydratase [Chthoniobacterales bacterium]